MKLLGIILGIVSLALIVDGATAQSCYRNYSYQSYYYAPTPIYVAQLAVTPVVVPSFTVGISPSNLTLNATTAMPAAQPAASTCESKIAALEARLNAVLAGKGIPQASEPAPASGGAGAVVMKKACASCHDKSVAGAKGKGIAFFDGDSILPMSGDLKVAMIDQVLSGDMPPGGKLSDEDVGSIVAYLTGRQGRVAPKATSK